MPDFTFTFAEQADFDKYVDNAAKVWNYQEFVFEFPGTLDPTKIPNPQSKKDFVGQQLVQRMFRNVMVTVEVPKAEKPVADAKIAEIDAIQIDSKQV